MDSSSIHTPDPGHLSVAPTPISSAEIKAQLSRILADRGFRNSPRIKRFLQLAVQRTLAGHTDQLKEYILGRDVFDRGVDFDPRTDSIVRVEARRLRRKLQEYYREVGETDPVAISFPLGSYVAEFARIPVSPAVLIQSKTERTAVVNPPDPRTVAVLPFSNLSSEPGQQYFCDGITEDIIVSLSSIPELKVIGTASMFTLKQSALDRREIGALLGAGTIVEGAVRKNGPLLRISVKIIDSETRQVRRSQVFDWKTPDLFAIEDEIAHSIADILRVELGAGGSNDIPGDASNAQAHILYLKGRQAWNRMTRDGYLSAIDYFSTAISRYPDYAPLHAGLADAYSWLGFWGMVRPSEVLPKSRHAALEALRLDPGSAAAHSSLGATMCVWEWKWEQGLELLRKAILLQPSYSLGQQRYGLALLIVGRFAEAVIHLEHAVRLDPLSIRTNRSLGVAHYLRGCGAVAQRWFDAAIALQPESAESYFLLARLHLQHCNYKGALDAALKCNTRQFSAHPLSILGVALARNGDKAGATRILGRLAKMSSIGYADSLASALVHLALGNQDAALDLLEKSLEERSLFAAFGNVDPLLDELRSGPRFRDLISSLKIPQP